MYPSELQKYLHDHIPLSKAMEVGVVQAQRDGVILSAPLAPNINHRDTVFGGSASALAILAAWSLLHIRLTAEGIASRLVIKSNTMSYERPIDGTFTAEAAIANAEVWGHFIRVLKRKNIRLRHAYWASVCSRRGTGSQNDRARRKPVPVLSTHRLNVFFY